MVAEKIGILQSKNQPRNSKLPAFNIVKRFELIKTDCTDAIKNLSNILTLYHLENRHVSTNFSRIVKNKLKIFEHHVEEITKYIQLLEDNKDL